MSTLQCRPRADCAVLDERISRGRGADDKNGLPQPTAQNAASFSPSDPSDRTDAFNADLDGVQGDRAEALLPRAQAMEGQVPPRPGRDAAPDVRWRFMNPLDTPQ